MCYRCMLMAVTVTKYYVITADVVYAPLCICEDLLRTHLTPEPATTQFQRIIGTAVVIRVALCTRNFCAASVDEFQAGSLRFGCPC